MYYFKVLVASQRYHGSEPLTYSHTEPLSQGAVTEVSLGTHKALGIVLEQVEKPTFSTKAITSIVTDAPIPRQLIELHAWMMKYYPSPLGLMTQLFLPSSLTTTARKKDETEVEVKKSINLPELNDEQTAATKAISEGKGSFLLHGETGSGKTRVYIELAERAMKQGKSSIILTPEIGLTAQLASTLEEAFPSRVIVVHSTQTPAQRRDKWNKIHDSKTPIVLVGPRSALFSPVHSLGLIVIDEAHDSAYKQDQMPYYQTSRVAAQLAHLHGAKLVLGTATPPIHDYYTFKAKDLPIVRMESSARGDSKVDVKVVDLTDRTSFKKSPWLSDELISSIRDALRNGYQSLVFLNRRGTARVVLCQNCSWQAACPRCDLPLTYHGDLHRLQCHTCGFTDKAPVSCPSCGQAEIVFKSIGTKTLITELGRLFPEARLIRFDSDNKKSESLETHFKDVHDGKVDIIVGTQMLSKGLDLPLLQVIGVVVADTSLYFPDYTAEERTFQMLRQVIGRVGRGHLPGKVIVQSYHPTSVAIETAMTKDFAQFYESQLSERELYRFPPFYFVLKISVSRAIETAARKAAHELAQDITRQKRPIELSGPSPAFREKINGRYHWQITIKAKQRTELIEIIKTLPKNCSYDIDPTNLL